MTTDEFNTKYSQYLEEGHYGLDINNAKFIKWLDSKFESFIKKPRFKYTQIKSKFGYGRFYCTGLSTEEIEEIENEISKLKKI